MIVVCIGLGFVGTAGDLISTPHTGLHAIFDVTGNLFLSYGSAAALILAVVQLRDGKR
jgi:hypothetical protein